MLGQVADNAVSLLRRSAQTYATTKGIRWLRYPESHDHKVFWTTERLTSVNRLLIRLSQWICWRACKAYNIISQQSRHVTQTVRRDCQEKRRESEPTQISSATHPGFVFRWTALFLSVSELLASAPWENSQKNKCPPIFPEGSSVNALFKQPWTIRQVGTETAPPQSQRRFRFSLLICQTAPSSKLKSGIWKLQNFRVISPTHLAPPCSDATLDSFAGKSATTFWTRTTCTRRCSAPSKVRMVFTSSVHTV